MKLPTLVKTHKIIALLLAVSVMGITSVAYAVNNNSPVNTQPDITTTTLAPKDTTIPVNVDNSFIGLPDNNTFNLPVSTPVNDTPVTAPTASVVAPETAPIVEPTLVVTPTPTPTPTVAPVVEPTISVVGNNVQQVDGDFHN